MQAVILAAGRGSRLKQLTEERPKPLCFVNVANHTLIEKMLDNLLEMDIKEIIIAVGYQKEYFYDYLGDEYKGANITYVEINDWAITNNAAGLYQVGEYIKGSFLIIEADEYFSNSSFLSQEKMKDDKNYWIGARQAITGCLLFTDEQMNLVNLEIVREKEKLEFLDNYYKSCGLVKIAEKFKSVFFEGLEEFLRHNEENKKKYFDIYIKENLAKIPLRVLPLEKDIIWGEIDDQNDLEDLVSLLNEKNKKLNYPANMNFDSDKRNRYWINRYLNKNIDETLYHLAGADRDASKKIENKLILYYFYRFKAEEKILAYFVKKYSRGRKRALDAGCGTARNAITLSRYFEEVDAFDISRHFLKENRRRFNGINFFVSDFINFESDKKYDLIFIGGVFMCMADEEVKLAMVKIKSLLAKDGILITRDSIAGGETKITSPIKVSRSEKYYELLITDGLKLRGKFNGPNRNIFCSIFNRLSAWIQKNKVVSQLFKVLIIMFIEIDAWLMLKRPFRRHRLANQLFYIFEKQ